MRFALYGKLPAKRDFVAIQTWRGFLATFEPWLQQGVASSRAQLGTAWQDSYLHAPIWRFWIGHAVCGMTMLGVLMPSVDGVGRYFPLVLAAGAEADETLPNPETEAHDAWLGAAEDILLSALGLETTLDELTAAVAGLGSPAATSGVGAVPGLLRLGRNTLAGPFDGDPPAAFAALRGADPDRGSAGSSYWWTTGGAAFRPRVMMAVGLPDPTIFAQFLISSREAGAPA
ncbi:type VI secretion system-associated protein TagF [Methylobacterium sp. 285MFTsu5.1]|uniref:type VI secretion system-associated protein TagF n=1 Tax=Methylobacterium sp. 285MFTsu5.1 TaxID=1172187 RepID=UPI000375B429|nr:type VI secretion system-associated protein TagF [Methylobacterium sp. 285MFTsu5.1]